MTDADKVVYFVNYWRSRRDVNFWFIQGILGNPDNPEQKLFQDPTNQHLPEYFF
jgi:hypothetical protein